MNEGADPTAIGDDEMQSLSNFYPYLNRLRSRKGLTKITSYAAWSDYINSMFAYKTSTGAWRLLLGGRTKIGYLDGNTISDVSNYGNAYSGSTDPWSWDQYVDMAYNCRNADGTIYRCDGSAIGSAGISAPGTAATIAQGAAGSLGAGDYIGLYTFRNSVTGAESNPCPVSNTLTLGASKKIDWTGITISTNPQVNQRRLYRTLRSQDGEYYYVGDIDNNVGTTFTDNVLQADMGSQASFDNGAPPVVCNIVVVWNERLWTTDGQNVYFSELGLPESFSEYSVIPVNPDDGHEIRMLLSFGSIILIGKTNSMYYVVGTDESDFDLKRLSDRHGCVSGMSAKTAEGFAWWFGGDNFYMTDGNRVEAIGDTNIRDTIDSIDPLYYDKVTGAVDETHSWYIAGVPANGAAVINKLLVYNYRSQKWTSFEYTNTAPQILADFYSTSYQPLIYTSLGTGHLYRWNYGNDDDGTAITASLLTKEYGFDRDDILKLNKTIAIHTNEIAEAVTLKLYGDGGLKDTATIANLAEYSSRWKRTALTNNDDLASYISLYLEYSGDQELEVKGIQFEIVDTGRRAKLFS